MGQELPRTMRILELNSEHALVTGLRTTHEANADDPALAEVAELLYGMALLAGGRRARRPAPLPAPARRPIDPLGLDKILDSSCRDARRGSPYLRV